MSESVIQGRELIGKVDEHLWPLIADNECTPKHVSPAGLITHNRLDLAIKILFLEMKSYSSDFARDIYESHLRCFSLGRFQEPGNEDKNSLERYIEDFEGLYESLRRAPFDSDKSYVPLAADGSILNGAHRVAAGYVTGRSVVTVSMLTPPPDYGYKFFLSRGMRPRDVEIAVSKFVEIAENVYIAILWPSSNKKSIPIDTTFGRVIYEKKVKLTYRGAHNLITQVYANEHWLGKEEEHYRGAEGKLAPCFGNGEDLRVVAFQAESIEQVTKIKTKVREMVGIGKHSIHITDTHEEAVRVSRLLFNENAVHFLNHSFPTKFPETHCALESFRQRLSLESMGMNRFVIDSGLVLALYGLRKARDIDVIALETHSFRNDGIDDHDSEMRFHGVSKSELILNPKYYFFYRGIKFSAFRQVYRMKAARREEKDLVDIEMMAALVEGGVFNALVAQVKKEMLFARARARKQIVEALKCVGLYRKARTIYRRLKGRDDD
ncbi:hypothetical protein [Thiohalomonas denitrificans]|nr:hypothetical protein [Thiohalomonas denitrificans]